MNNITRCFASSGSLFTKRIQLLAGAHCGRAAVTSAIRFPSSSDLEDRQQHRRSFGSIAVSRRRDCSTGFSDLTSSLTSLKIGRDFSSNATAESNDNSNSFEQQLNNQVVSPTTPTMFTDSESGEQYGIILDTRKLPRLKPGVVRRRLDKCRTYVGREQSIRHSPWKLNRICQLASGLTLEEALTQLKFCDKKNADLVAKVLKRTSNLGDIRDGLQISQLEVAECFATRSMMLRRIKPMGRGRHGVMHHKFSHIRVVLREIDFPLRIYQQTSLNQKKKWMYHQQRAENDARAAMAKREELERLEKQQQAQLEERKKAASKQ
uniref:50S ribosomal protein L22, chloroplastic n=1 Tax=Pseudo-nitzschia australis TaxID=44445 RepID=A0A6V0D6B5_9STRA|mmetsp:Transcript_8180/g.17660  ORF Transcript_8180/g.17660 Transcript_8180/m.17660 type:complete len:321 (+) Transcript_8180:124-1086(+)|eukprot:CAMPEP_0168201532 /NCGR_PEP_ID=MMETSP0139_2-20121125/23761_1 /TAXON_ID=44445 /ORGANISM="Pseudo-nitzschia australis, Strain 10249 10 AB" /LENGTH=320 /DNA_ID=CAMNT_0008127103 /DNA_START=56 /DNA_END=1018 /DNA_ORIENTATION=-